MLHSPELPRKSTISPNLFNRIVVRMGNMLFTEAVGNGQACVFRPVCCPFTVTAALPGVSQGGTRMRSTLRE